MKIRNLYIGTIRRLKNTNYNKLDSKIEGESHFERISILYRLSRNSLKVRDVIYGGTYVLGPSANSLAITPVYVNNDDLDSIMLYNVAEKPDYIKKNISKKKILEDASMLLDEYSKKNQRIEKTKIIGRCDI